jgi:hypothetical protein
MPYDKFDDDIEKSGLRFDGNEPSYNRKQIKKIVARSFFTAIAVIILITFAERQRYSFNERHLNHINTVGDIHFTTFYGATKINRRTLNVESGFIAVSQINYIDGGDTAAQIRFHLLAPNPFFGGDLNNLTFTAAHGNSYVPAPSVYMKSFWGCQMLNVTFTLTEETTPPKPGEPLEIAIRGEGISAALSLTMP